MILHLNFVSPRYNSGVGTQLHFVKFHGSRGVTVSGKLLAANLGPRCITGPLWNKGYLRSKVRSNYGAKANIGQRSGQV